MIRRGAIAILMLLLLGAAPSSAAEGDPRWNGDLPDPAVVWADGSWWAFGTSDSGGAAAIPFLRSNDLRRWTFVGDALSARPAWAPQRALWAPGLAHIGGSWRLYYSARHATLGIRCIAVASSAVVDGPYVNVGDEPLLCQADRGGSIDPAPFIDGDGTPWLLWKSEGQPQDEEAALWSQRLAPDGLSLSGEPWLLLERRLSWEDPVIENPSLVLHRDRYLLFYSGGPWNTDRYAMGHAWCASPRGPCQRGSDAPIATSNAELAGPGGQSAFRDRDGRLKLGFHAWPQGKVGYNRGGVRGLRVTAVRDEGPAVAIGLLPEGAIDWARQVPGGIVVSGWAADGDAEGHLPVRLELDGRDAGTQPAGGERPDVAAHRGLPARSGFERRLDARPGYHSLCAVGLNAGLGADRVVSCTPVRLSATPAGRLDSASGGSRRIRVVGWALDPEVASPIDVHVYVDGAAVRALRAGAPRPDVGRAHPSYGDAHGFDVEVPVFPGRHQICVYGISVGEGANAAVGCATVNATG